MRNLIMGLLVAAVAGYVNSAIAQDLGDGYYVIVARHNLLSLDVRGAGREGAIVQTAGFGEQSNREWRFIPTGDGYYVIVAKHSGLGLDVQGAGGCMAILQTAGLGGQPNRQFKIVPVGDGFVKIIARHSGLSLDVRDAGGQFAPLQTAGDGGQKNREFLIIPVGQVRAEMARLGVPAHINNPGAAKQPRPGPK